MDMHKNLLKIQEVSRRLKVPTHTLRFWEKALHGVIVPFRTKGGQRLYSNETISLIEEIKDLRDKGISLAEIKSMFGRVEAHENDTFDTPGIDLLAERVAKAVRSEISRFLRENGI
jgi:DNA-binding transcriptional MerR regulator